MRGGFGFLGEGNEFDRLWSNGVRAACSCH